MSRTTQIIFPEVVWPKFKLFGKQIQGVKHISCYTALLHPGKLIFLVADRNSRYRATTNKVHLPIPLCITRPLMCAHFRFSNLEDAFIDPRLILVSQKRHNFAAISENRNKSARAVSTPTSRACFFRLAKGHTRRVHRTGRTADCPGSRPHRAGATKSPTRRPSGPAQPEAWHLPRQFPFGDARGQQGTIAPATDRPRWPNRLGRSTAQPSQMPRSQRRFAEAVRRNAPGGPAPDRTERSHLAPWRLGSRGDADLDQIPAGWRLSFCGSTATDTPPCLTEHAGITFAVLKPPSCARLQNSCSRKELKLSRLGFGPSRSRMPFRAKGPADTDAFGARDHSDWPAAAVAACTEPCAPGRRDRPPAAADCSLCITCSWFGIFCYACGKSKYRNG